MYESIEDGTKILQKRLCGLLAIEQKLERLQLPESAEEFSRLTEELVAKTEKLTCMVRKLAVDSFVSSNETVMRKATEIQGIQAQKNGEVLEIEIPFILPKKKLRNSKFISDPLFYVLNTKVQEDNFRIRERAVVCFVYTYSGTNTRLTARDYDNLESKKILDVIALFALQDDGAEFCDIFHKMERGEKDKTNIYVMPERCFWERKYAHRNGTAFEDKTHDTFSSLFQNTTENT